MAAETRKEQIGFDACDILKQADQGGGAGRAGRTGGAGRQNGRTRHFAIRVALSKTMADLGPNGFI